MRYLILFFFILIVTSLSAFSQTNIKSVLILGDSYLKGHFGEFLQKRMHEEGKYDILSIAIGGAGTKSFIPVMKNRCCGYRVRQTCAGIALTETKKEMGTKIPVLERAEMPTETTVMKSYGGSLLSVMNAWKPDAIILVLGSNYINAHEDFFKIIYSYNDSIPIIWVGPFDKNTSAGRYALIKKTLKDKPNCLLVKSDSIVAKQKITPTHFYGTTAKKLSESIFNQFETFLDSSMNKKKTQQIPIDTKSTFPFKLF